MFVKINKAGLFLFLSFLFFIFYQLSMALVSSISFLDSSGLLGKILVCFSLLILAFSPLSFILFLVFAVFIKTPKKANLGDSKPTPIQPRKINKAGLFFILTIVFLLINGYFISLGLAPSSAPKFLDIIPAYFTPIILFGLPISFCLFLYFWAFGKK